jgi:hypothetical protein
MDKAAQIREKANGLGAIAKSMSSNVAGMTEDAMDYLRRRGLRRMGRDLTRCVSRNPVESMMAVMAVGFLTGFLSRRH